MTKMPYPCSVFDSNRFKAESATPLPAVILQDLLRWQGEHKCLAPLGSVERGAHRGYLTVVCAELGDALLPFGSRTLLRS